MTTTPPLPKPTKAVLVSGLKEHLAAAYPGCEIKLMSGAYCIYLPPIEKEPDFIIPVHTRDEMKKILNKSASTRTK